MKKENIDFKVELENKNNLLDAIHDELASSEDFILSYIKTMCIIHGGKFNLEELRHKYGWKMPKVAALTAAINHFAARGLVKRGATVYDVELK
jgi:hypothetical protein